MSGHSQSEGLFMLYIPIENHVLNASRQVERMCHFTSKPLETLSLSLFYSVKMPEMNHSEPKTCTTCGFKRQFATPSP